MTAAPSWYRLDPAQRRLTLTLHIQPNARATAVAGRHGDALKIRIAAPAVDDKANAALIDFLHQWFKLPNANIKIKHGARGRRKIVELDLPGAGIQTLLARMESACPANSNNE
jgi:uncharacterized protein (TIGR00251 family)